MYLFSCIGFGLSILGLICFIPLTWCHYIWNVIKDPKYEMEKIQEPKNILLYFFYFSDCIIFFLLRILSYLFSTSNHYYYYYYKVLIEPFDQSVNSKIFKFLPRRFQYEIISGLIHRENLFISSRFTAIFKKKIV